MHVKPRLTRRELATRLRVQPNTLAHWAVDGKGPKFINVNGRVLYDLEEVERWEAARTHASTAEFDTGARAANLLPAATAWNERRREERAVAVA
jgi:hypothetical protein